MAHEDALFKPLLATGQHSFVWVAPPFTTEIRNRLTIVVASLCDSPTRTTRMAGRHRAPLEVNYGAPPRESVSCWTPLNQNLLAKFDSSARSSFVTWVAHSRVDKGFSRRFAS